jgi:hypothetical protein
MGAQRTKDEKSGAIHVTKGELLEGSFVTVPSNRDALVLAAKTAKVTTDTDLLQKLHDLSVSQGATCEHKHEASSTEQTEPVNAAAPATASPADVARIYMARAQAEAASVL